MRPKNSLAAAAMLLMMCVAIRLAAQGPPAAPPTGQGPPGQGAAPGQGGRGRGQATFPAQQRPPGDPAVIARGKTLYDVNCRLCHGADLRGGDMGGVNLLRSTLVLTDQHGELILPVVRSGRQTPGLPPMPPFPQIAEDDVKAIAEYIHSVAATMRGQGNPPPGAPVVLNILVGDANAGKAYFAAKCASCHSATGDLQGIGMRYADPVQLQNSWVAGGVGGGRGGRGGRGGGAAGNAARSRDVTVTVTTPSGQKLEGRLDRIDDFIVILTPADGVQRSVRRNGDVPKIEIRDPLEGHRKLLTEYTDKDMHDVTAYLVTLK